MEITNLRLVIFETKTEVKLNTSVMSNSNLNPNRETETKTENARMKTMKKRSQNMRQPFKFIISFVICFLPKNS